MSKKKAVFLRTANVYDDSRATKEILALLEAGYKVVVLGWNRNGRAEEECKKAFASYETDLEFRFYPIQLEGGIGLKNIHILLGWIRWANKQIRNLDDIAVVHACNLDAGLATINCFKKKVPVIYDIYDYYVDSHSIPRVAVSSVEKLEHYIINKAAATIICTEERYEQIQETMPQKIVVIHNSPDVEEVKKTECRYDYAYCGSLCERRLIKEVLDGYRDNQDLRFIFAGNDIYLKLVEAMGKQYENFSFCGTIPYAEVLEIESSARTIAAIYEPSIRNHRLCAPNKFYEALALGKPVIVCKGTGIDKIVQKENIGIVIDYDANQFYDAVRWFKENEEVCMEMGEKARKLYESKFRWSIMKSRLINLYKEIDNKN